MTHKEYNGYTNYETWSVKLLMDNDEGSCTYWREQAERCARESQKTESAYARLTGKEIFTPLERATTVLVHVLKSEFEEQNPITDASLWADLMNAALSEVDWDEIAKSLLGDLEASVWATASTPEEVEANGE